MRISDLSPRNHFTGKTAMNALTGKTAIVTGASKGIGAAIAAGLLRHEGVVEQITRALAKELGPRNIRVNTVAPGVTLTEGLRTEGMDGGDTEKMVIAGTPLGRIGTPEDIVPAVVFLASDAARWITGEKLAASGGLRF
jgi:NAD(P)-dependent dehydrogenase (short-subunit alcohol dehydrogenase family)